MLIAKLIEHFDQQTTLHIDVNEVRDQLVSLGVDATITFHFVKMDVGRIRGLLDLWERQAGVYNTFPETVADIVVNSDMGEEDWYWKRLVAVKELLHLADCETLRAESREAVDVIFHKFALPPELRFSPKAGNNTRSFLNDATRFYLALAVLVPKACRELLRPLYVNETLRDHDIAEFAQIPERYVSEVMSEGFEHLIQSFLEWEKGEQPS